jgi:peptidoglycan/LPS O-acetylase OafA/YrhL
MQATILLFFFCGSLIGFVAGSDKRRKAGSFRLLALLVLATFVLVELLAKFAAETEKQRKWCAADAAI